MAAEFDFTEQGHLATTESAELHHITHLCTGFTEVTYDHSAHHAASEEADFFQVGPMATSSKGMLKRADMHHCIRLGPLNNKLCHSDTTYQVPTN